MTWRARAAVAGGALAALVGSFAVGRYSAPKSLERDHIVTSERDTELTWHAYVGHTVTVAKSSTQWRTVTKWEPGGTVIQIREAAKQTETTTTKDETTTARSETTADKRTDVERLRQPLAKAPDWFAAVRAGVDLRLSPQYGASVARRIAGPLYFELWGQRPWAGGVGLGLSF